MPNVPGFPSDGRPASEGTTVRDVGPPGLEIAEELGRGTQTVVYRARRQGVDYALKMLRESVYADDAAWVAFRREAATLTSVAHPGLTRIHEVGQADGRPYLVMELVEGQTLTGLLDAGALDEARAATIAVDVAGARGARADRARTRTTAGERGPGGGRGGGGAGARRARAGGGGGRGGGGGGEARSARGGAGRRGGGGDAG